MLITITLDSCGFPRDFFIWLDWLFYTDVCLCEQAPWNTIIVSVNLQHAHCDSSHITSLLKRLQRGSLDAVFPAVVKIWMSFAVFAGQGGVMLLLLLIWKPRRKQCFFGLGPGSILSHGEYVCSVNDAPGLSAIAWSPLSFHLDSFPS